MVSMTRHVLIVEDDMLVAMLVEDMVRDLGYEVIGPASTVKEAMLLIEQRPIDCAILDINLGRGVVSAPIAQELGCRDIPFIFASGYGSQDATEGAGGTLVLNKPYRLKDLDDALRAVVKTSRPPGA